MKSEGLTISLTNSDFGVYRKAAELHHMTGACEHTYGLNVPSQRRAAKLLGRLPKRQLLSYQVKPHKVREAYERRQQGSS